MTATYVKDLTEELKRYSPDARLQLPVECSDVSPATQCTIGIIDDETEEKIANLEEENEGLRKINHRLVSALNAIKSVMEDDLLTDTERRTEIETQLETL